MIPSFYFIIFISFHHKLDDQIVFLRSIKGGSDVLYLSEQARGQMQLRQKVQEDITGES